MRTPTVRAAAPDDAEAISDVHIRAWQWAYDGLMPADYLARRAEDRTERIRRWREHLVESANRVFVVLDADDRVVGFVSFGTYRESQDDSRPIDGEGEVIAINVIREVAGTGAGRALMDAAVGWLRERGLSPIRLWVLEDNPRARRFYERYGFVLDGERSTITAGTAELAEVRYTLAADGQPDQ
jgi:ribosomal protein S18 acetylase RimI-like enzyme